MTLDDFKSGFKSYTITYMHKNWNSSFIEKRGAVSKRLYKFNFRIGDENAPNSLAALSARDIDISLIENNDVQVAEVQSNKATNKILETLEAHLTELEHQSVNLNEGKPADEQNLQVKADLNLDLQSEDDLSEDDMV